MSNRTDQIDEIIERLSRIEKHLGFPEPLPPPIYLPVIQSHHFHVDLSSSFYAPALCGFYGKNTSGEENKHLCLLEFQEIIDSENSHVLCPQCFALFQQKYSREVVRGIFLSISVGKHRERVARMIDSLGLPADRVTYGSSVSFWQSCLMLKSWKPSETGSDG